MTKGTFLPRLRHVAAASFAAVSMASLVVAIGSFSGCSTIKGEKSAEDLSRSGPTILNTRVNPGTVELSRDMNPLRPVEILTEVKDFGANVNDVRVRFLEAPLEVKMSHVGGTTWRASLTPEQIRSLAVGNQTTQYRVSVIARNEDGQEAISRQAATVAVKAPDLARTTS